MESIKKYNELWEAGKYTNPICILIGGAAATGKSSLAQKLQHEISHMNLMVTPLIRSMLKLFIPKDTNPYLYQHTFDLVKHYIEDGDRKKLKLLLDRYELQSKPIGFSIEEFIEFIASERQNYIIEGSNILPHKRAYEIENLILIEFYMQVSDEDAHREMFSGPTHNRYISNVRFRNLRLLNDYVAKEAKRHNKKIFEYNTDYKEILKYIDEEVGKKLQEK